MPAATLRDIYLYGELGRRFGKVHRLAVSSPAEAFRALFTLRPGLKQFIRNRGWRVIVGRNPRRGYACRDTDLSMTPGSQPIHILPALSLAKATWLPILIGVVIIGAAIVFSGGLAAPGLAGLGTALGTTFFMGITYGQILAFGVAMVLAGVAGLLTPTMKSPKASDKAAADNNPSFLFNGATNTSEQGLPVPIVYGTFTIGSIVIDAAIDVIDISPEDQPVGEFPKELPEEEGGSGD